MNTLHHLADPCTAPPTLDLARLPPLKGGCTPDARCSVASDLARADCKACVQPAHVCDEVLAPFVRAPGDELKIMDIEEMEIRFPQLAKSRKEFIRLEATRAAKDGKTRAEACPYDYRTSRGQHWTACFILAGGKLK